MWRRVYEEGGTGTIDAVLRSSVGCKLMQAYTASVILGNLTAVSVCISIDQFVSSTVDREILYFRVLNFDAFNFRHLTSIYIVGRARENFSHV